MTKDEKEIRGVLAELVTAIRNKDAEAMIAPLAEDEVTFDLAPPLRIAPEQTHDPSRLEQWLSTWQGPIKSEPHDLTVVGDRCAGEQGADRLDVLAQRGHRIGQRPAVAGRVLGGEGAQDQDQPAAAEFVEGGGALRHHQRAAQPDDLRRPERDPLRGQPERGQGGDRVAVGEQRLGEEGGVEAGPFGGGGRVGHLAYGDRRVVAERQADGVGGRGHAISSKSVSTILPLRST